MKKILVLGGTGIIGTHVCRCALEEGAHVWCLSRRGALPFAHENLKIIKCDVYNTAALNDTFSDLRFDAVLDLLSFNAGQLRGMADLFRKRTSQYLAVSSSTVYKSKMDGLITEDTERINYGWNYSLEKMRMEEVLIKLAVNQPWTYTIIRPYITYSEQRIPAAEFELPDIYERIQTGRSLPIGDEILNTVTTVTHASDLARGIVGLIGNRRAVNTVFNIASDDFHTWKEIIDEIGKNLGKTPIYASAKIDKVKKYFPCLSGKIEDRLLTRRFDTKKIKQAVPGFTCKYDIAEGFREVFPKTVAHSDILTQAVLDCLAIKINRKAYRPAIVAYTKLFRGKWV